MHEELQTRLDAIIFSLILFVGKTIVKIFDNFLVQEKESFIATMAKATVITMFQLIKMGLCFRNQLKIISKKKKLRFYKTKQHSETCTILLQYLHT